MPAGPSGRFWQCERRSGVRGCPQGKRRGEVRGFPRSKRCRQARQANFGSVSGAAGCEVARKVSGAAGVRELPQNARPPAGPALQPPKTNGAEAPGNAAAFRASAPEENKEHTKRDKENHMSRAVLQPTRPAVAEPPRSPAGTEKRGAGLPRPGGASTHPPPGGGGTAPAARRDREEGGRPAPTGQGFNPPAARRWRNRPGRPPGQRRGGRPAATGRCFNPPAARR